MPSIEFSDFKGGLDLRRDVALSATNVLPVLRNCYIDNARAIRKRPCLVRVATLEAGTKGLRAAGGKLNTFYTQEVAVTHANTLFRANRVAFPGAASDIADVHYGELFNGYLYCAIEYANGQIKHHYLDDPGAWAAATAYSVGNFRRPTTANGFRYEVTSISGTGTSAGSEPVWPTTVGSTVTDNPGANQVVWTCRSFAVVDSACPHSRQVKKIQQKLYAADGADVAYCKTSDPRDWSAVSDAGFIAAGVHAAGSDTVTALGEYGGDLVVFFADSLQVWDIDPDPSLNSLKDTVNNIGTVHHDSLGEIANDLLFLGKQGFRSLSVVTLTDNLQENDVGSPIDPIRTTIADDDNLLAAYYPTLGQLWEVKGDQAFVYSFSKSAKINAWSIFDFDLDIDVSDVAVLNNELYLRSGDDVYRVDISAYDDAGDNPLCEVEFFYQDAKAPGVLKMFTGMDLLARGSWEVAFRYDPRDTSLITPFLPLGGDTRPGELIPMELCATSIAPVFRHEANEPASIHSLLCYYEKLGNV